MAVMHPSDAFDYDHDMPKPGKRLPPDLPEGYKTNPKPAPDDDIRDYVPLLDYVLVETDDQLETKTAGGIIVPDQAAKAGVEGRVVAAGPGNHQNGVFIPNRVRVGMWVRFGNWAAGNERKIKVAGKVYLLMREEDCLMTRPSRFAK